VYGGCAYGCGAVFWAMKRGGDPLMKDGRARDFFGKPPSLLSEGCAQEAFWICGGVWGGGSRWRRTLRPTDLFVVVRGFGAPTRFEDDP